MASRKPGADSTSLANLVSDYRRALATLQELTEEFASRLRGSEVAAISAAPSDANSHGVVEIACLGRFSVRVSGRPIELPASGRPAAILKVLAHRGGRPLSREQLVELLWPGVATDVGANRLRVAMHALRQAIGDDIELVAFEQGKYRLKAEHVVIDAERFEALVDEGRELASGGDVAGARERYEAADQLYRGDYFEDDPFEEWAAVRQQHLRDLYLNTLVKLALMAMERADYDACVGYGHAIVREDVSSEDAYRLLMLAHARLGNRARALRWYELCAQALKRELDLEPSAATEQLRDEIAREDATDGRSVRERLGLGALGGLLATLGGVGFGTKATVAVAAAMFAVLAAGGAHEPSRPVSIRVASAAEVEAAAEVNHASSVPPASAGDQPVVGDEPAHVARPHDEAAEGAPRGGGHGSELPAPVADRSPAAVEAPPTPIAARVSPTPPQGPPPEAGPPANAGPKEGQGSAPEFAGPPDHAGPKVDAGGGPPSWAGPPENAGPKEGQGNAPDSAGPPEDAGPKEGQGNAPDAAGPPENAGPKNR